ncbi:hypothetical protein, partial [Microcoleus sp. B3-D3]
IFGFYIFHFVQVSYIIPHLSEKGYSKILKFLLKSTKRNVDARAKSNAASTTSTRTLPLRGFNP